MLGTGTLRLLPCLVTCALKGLKKVGLIAGNPVAARVYSRLGFARVVGTNCWYVNVFDGRTPEEWVADTVDFFSRVCDEDRAIVERIQQGTRAPLASPGRLSWLEHELHDLMGYLADRLT